MLVLPRGVLSFREDRISWRLLPEDGVEVDVGEVGAVGLVVDGGWLGDRVHWSWEQVRLQTGQV